MIPYYRAGDPDNKPLQYMLLNESQVDYFRSVPGGTPEQPLIDWAMQFMEEGKTFVDIGAHLGTWSFGMTRVKDTSILAFEPQLSTFYQLCGGIALNDLHERVTAHRVALSNNPSATLLKIVSEDGGGSSIQNIPTHTSQFVTRVELVDVETLDRYNPEDVGLIKIDVEGKEADVLRGAKATIDRYQPKILIESWDPVRRPWAETLRKDTFDVLRSLGYDVVFTNWPDIILAEPKKPLLE